MRREILALSARRKEVAFVTHAMVTVGFTIVLTAAVTTRAPGAQIAILAAAAAANLLILACRLARMPRQRDLRRIVERAHAVILIDLLSSNAATAIIRVVFADRSVALLRLPLDEAHGVAPILARQCPLAMNRLPWLAARTKRRTPLLRGDRSYVTAGSGAPSVGGPIRGRGVQARSFKPSRVVDNVDVARQL